MSEFTAPPGEGEDGGAASPAGAGSSAGQLLRQMRQAAGMHIAALATTLKVPVERLEALEADRYEDFKDHVFMRALAAGACRVLKHDPAPILALLPGGAPAPLRIHQGINASIRDTPLRGSFTGGGEAPRSRLLLAAVALLLLGALAIIVWPAGLTLDQLLPGRTASQAPALTAEPPSQPAQSALPEAAGQPPGPAAPAPQTEVPAAPTPTPVPAPVPVPAASDAAAAPAGSVPAASAPATAATVAAPAASAPAAAPNADLVLRAREQSWVQVRSGGAVVLQKTLEAGESVAVPGTAPWSVVIGRADATEVIVRGQPMDLKTLARDNVARFEVK